MASPEVLAFEHLLAPIPGDNPAGTDLRADPSPVSDYYSIRDARKEARNRELLLDRGEDAPPPDWRSIVIERSKQVLAEKSKDLEMVAYLIEGLVRDKKAEFAGLRDGFRLARELVEGFWQHLYPDPGGTDYESRFSTILWLSGIDKPGTLIVPVRKIPLTASAGGDGAYSLSNYLSAQAFNQQVTDPKVRQKRIEEGAVTVEQIRAAVATTPTKFYVELLEGLDQARAEFEGFGKVFSEKSGYDVPSSDLNGVLDEFRSAVMDLAKDKLPKPAPAAAPAAEGATGETAGQAEASVAAGPTGAIRNRDDALNRLEAISTYFREREPHSIIPFALDQVAKWARMGLPELLSELIPDDAPRKNLFKQVGIRPTDGKS
jgi:type VI secretion system protein ImpA